MTNELQPHFRNITDQLKTLRNVFSADRLGSKYLAFFEEYLSANEFELALHAVCDFLLQPAAPPADAATLGRIETLHKLMGLRDNCAVRLKEK